MFHHSTRDRSVTSQRRPSRMSLPSSPKRYRHDWTSLTRSTTVEENGILSDVLYN